MSKRIFLIIMILISFYSCNTHFSNMYNGMTMRQCDSLLNQFIELNSRQQQHLALKFVTLIDNNAFDLIEVKASKYPQAIDYVDEMIAITNEQYHPKLYLLKYRVLINGLYYTNNVNNKHHLYLRKKIFEKLDNDNTLLHRQRIMLYLETSKIADRADSTNLQSTNEQRLTKLNLLSKALILAQNKNDSLAIGRLKIRTAVIYSTLNMIQQTQDILDELTTDYMHFLSPDQIVQHNILQYNIHSIHSNWEKAYEDYPQPDQFTQLYATLLVRCNKVEHLYKYLITSKYVNSVNDSLRSTMEQFSRNNYMLWCHVQQEDTLAAENLFKQMTPQFKSLVHNKLILNGHPQFLTYGVDKYIQTKQYNEAINFINTYVKNSSLRYQYTNFEPYPEVNINTQSFSSSIATFGRIKQIDNLLHSLKCYLRVYTSTDDKQGIKRVTDNISAIHLDRITVSNKLQNNAYASFMHRNNIKEKMNIYKAEKEFRIKKTFQIWVFGIVITLLLVIFYYYYHNDKHNIYLLYLRQKERIDTLQKLRYKIVANKNIKSDIFQLIEKTTTEQQLYLQQDFSIVKLSEILGHNRTYISNAINQNTGMNFNQWLNKLRMEHILKDYNKVKMNIERHIATYGFASRSTFYRAFKLHTGKTPKQYLEEYLQQKNANKT